MCAMEERLLHEVFGVSEDYCSMRTEVKGSGDVFIAVEPLDKLYLCPKCRSRDVIGKGKRTRRVQTLPIGFHAVYLEVAVLPAANVIAASISAFRSRKTKNRG